jgi:tetratricopeptide (TPR) repeat protein
MAAWIGLALTAQGKIPGADDPNAYTESKYRKDLLDFNLRTMVDAYKQFGNHNPKWDDTAAQFLAAMATRFTNVGADGRYYLRSQLKNTDLEKLGRAAIDAGCDDPLVMDMFSIVLLDEKKLDEHRPLARKAVDALLNSQYPVARATNSARRAMQDMDPQKEKDLLDRYDQNVFDGDLATINFGHFPGNDRRFILLNIESDLARWTTEKEGFFYQTASGGKADPWLTDMIGGMYHIRAAWDARGDGWANTVTPEGWRKFQEEIAAAHKCLSDAYNIAPNFPEAAEQMIIVAMAESDNKGLRDWFDRSVKAQFDYYPAYTTYLYALYPRWLGDYPQMYSFAQECAATKRYDTLVPMFYVRTLQKIRADMSGNWQYFRIPGAFEKLTEVLSAYAEQDAPLGYRPWYYSDIVGYAWEVGRYQDGRAALDKIDGKFDIGGINDSTAPLPRRIVSGTYAFTGTNKDDLAKAEADVATGKLDAGIDTYIRLAKAIDPKDHAARWIRGRAQELTWKRSFDAGEWVDLEAGSDLTGFETVYGKFSRDDKGIVGVSDRYGSALICGNRFGNRWEMQAKLEILPPDAGKPIPEHSDAGLFFSWISGSECYGALPDPAAGQATLLQAPARPLLAPIKLDAQPTIKVKMWDGTINVGFDSQDFLKNHQTADWATSPNCYIGIGGTLYHPGTRFRITEFKIHKLSDEPAHSN